MCKTNTGDRVATTHKIKDNVIEIFGYGTRLEEAVPDAGTGSARLEHYRKKEQSCPVVILDDGQKVYDPESKYMREKDLHKMMDEEGKEVVIVSLSDYRKADSKIFSDEIVKMKKIRKLVEKIENLEPDAIYAMFYNEDVGSALAVCEGNAEKIAESMIRHFKYMGRQGEALMLCLLTAWIKEKALVKEHAMK